MAKAGRPKIEFDYDLLAGLRSIACTDEEIAVFFGCSTDTIGRRKQDDPKFAEAYNNGWALGNQSLRRKQFEVAMGGNVGMLIWLGKQRLGQREEGKEITDELVTKLPDEKLESKVRQALKVVGGTDVDG